MPTPLARVVIPLVMDLALLPSEMWFKQKVQGPNTKKPNTYLSSNFAKRKTGQERVNTQFFPSCLNLYSGLLATYPWHSGVRPKGTQRPAARQSLCSSDPPAPSTGDIWIQLHGQVSRHQVPFFPPNHVVYGFCSVLHQSQRIFLEITTGKCVRLCRSWEDFVFRFCFVFG